MKFDGYKQKLDSQLNGLYETYGSLGQTLLDAWDDEEVNKVEYDNLEKHLIARGLKQADIKAMKAVAAGTLNMKLFFSGVANSKILTLKKEEQDRLISGEKLPVKRISGEIEYMSWEDMDEDAKNQILGAKGGGIKAPHEQEPKAAGKVRKTFQFTDADMEKRGLVLSNDKIEGEIDISLLGSRLKKAGALEKFMDEMLTWQANNK